MMGKILDRIKPLFPFRESNILLLGYRGSMAHGTYIQGHIDDIDVMGITMTPFEYVFGLDRYEQTERKHEEIDLLIYDFRKYFRLLLGSNPNVMNLLWLNDEHYLLKSESGKRLIENRDLFISKQCYYTYGGYARGQMQRMTHFQKYEGYMGEKRKTLVDKFGYDTKNAAHCLRLLNMGIEILTTGIINVWRKDNRLYVAVKYGEWSLSAVQDEATRLFTLLQEAFVRSKLRTTPDVKQAKKLCMEIMRDFYNIGSVSQSS